MNGSINLVTLYNKVPYLKKINQGKSGRARSGPSRLPQRDAKQQCKGRQPEDGETKIQMSGSSCWTEPCGS